MLPCNLTGRPQKPLLLAVCLLVITWVVLPATAQDSGEDLFLHKCAVCHGKDGSGNTAKGKKLKVSEVHGNVRRDSEEKMTNIVVNGKGEDMASFKKELSKEQIQAVVKYYRSLAK